MGRVFSADDLWKRKILMLSDFDEVSHEVKERLSACDGVIGGLMFGSVLWKHYTKRSDLDCLVLYDSCLVRINPNQLFLELNKFAAGFYVPLQLIGIDVAIAQVGLSDVGPSFFTHLQLAVNYGGIIKKNPLPFFKPPAMSFAEDAREYLRRKWRKMQNGVNSLLTLQTCDLFRFLQKVLEAPIHIARKMLHVSSVLMETDSKQEVIAHYSKIASAKELELFEKIVGIDSEYSAELDRQWKNFDIKSSYKKMIDKIKATAYDTLEFTKLNLLRFA